MIRGLFLSASVITLCLIFCALAAKAQTTPAADLKKFELAADFSSITFGPGHSEPGLGTRLTYNLNKHVALEAAGYFFPRKCEFCSRLSSGRITEGLFGVKVGKRFEKWGIFAKVRPGVISFSEGKFNFVPITVNPPTGVGAFPFDFEFKRLTTFAADVGGVLEFYPTKRIVTRFDFGNTIIHYGPRTSNFLVFDSATGKNVLVSSTIPAQNRGSVQFMAGVGFRF